VFCDDEYEHRLGSGSVAGSALAEHLGFVLQLGDELLHVGHACSPAWTLRRLLDLERGSGAARRRRRDRPASPSSSRFLLRLHDVGQRRVARLVEPQVGRHHGGQRRCSSRLEPAIDLARDGRALLSPTIFTFEANVTCGQPRSAASIWPVWLASSSIACLPQITSSGADSLSTTVPSAAWRRPAAPAADIGLDQDATVGTDARARYGSSPGRPSRRSDTATISVTAAGFLQADSFLDPDLVERVHRHLDVGQSPHPELVRLDPDLDVVIDTTRLTATSTFKRLSLSLPG
jgi:hypothetical protein